LSAEQSLHPALKDKAPLEVVQALMAAYPEAAREKDKEGQLPLHSALTNQAPLEVVKALLEAARAGVLPKMQ
jgi:ankyrin repeat protein